MSDNENKVPEKRPGFFVRAGARISKWFREMRSELKKVVWPTLKQVRNNTGIVIAAVILVGAIIAAFDWVSTNLVMLLINSLKGA